MKRWKIAALTVLLAGICLILPARAYADEEMAGDETLVSGIIIGGIDVGGMTPSEAENAVQGYIDGLRDTVLDISFNGEVSSISMKDLGFAWENTDVVAQAAVLGNTGNILERYKSTSSLENENAVFELDYSWKENKLREFLQKEAEKRKTEPVEATLAREDGKFVTTESVTGVTVDVAATLKEVKDALGESWDGGEIKVEAVAEIVEPTLTTEMVEAVQDLLGEYKTNFNPGETDRTANLRVGVSYLDGVLLMPGDSYSFFDYLYPITAAKGYRKATTYQGGRYVDSLGGGICQISTTCYNAVLLAELEVVERSPHTMTVSYVKPGLDSGQAWSSGRNLVFKNDTDYPVYIEAYASSRGVLYVGLWGKETRPANRKVEYYSKYSEEWVYGGQESITYDPSRPYGSYERTQNEYPKVSAMAYKRVIVDGKVVSDEPLYDAYDHYRATPIYAIVGTGGLSPEEYLAGQAPPELPPEQQPQPEQPPQEQPQPEQPPQEQPQPEQPPQEQPPAEQQPEG